MATARDAAAQMLEWFQQQRGELMQLDAACKLDKVFGRGTFTYFNVNGNPAISAAVLREFRTITGPDVVWSRSLYMWRKRQHGDPAGRRQVY
jgi:hypothetical protein